jgi:hypothetical protein
MNDERKSMGTPKDLKFSLPTIEEIERELENEDKA